MQFNIEASDATRLLQRHRDTVAFMSEAVAGSERHTALKTELKGLDTTIGRIVRVQQILPSDTGMLEQLVDRDDVHDFGVQSVSEMRDMRVGGADSNKLCVAVVNPFTASRVPEVLAAIYVYKSAGEIPVVGYDGVNGHAKPIYDYRALPGDVDAILHEGVERMDATPRALIFYSITNIKVDGTQTPLLKGSGERLIAGLFPFVQGGIDAGLLPQEIVASTLSPMRSLRTAWKDTDFNLDAIDDDLKTTLTVSHLLTGRDGVQRFHGSNGILIGDVKLRANTPESLDGVKGASVMINYVYDLDETVRIYRQNLHRSRRYGELMAPHLKPNLATIAQDLRLKIAQ